VLGLVFGQELVERGKPPVMVGLPAQRVLG
jgi:hypothetical protein